MNEAETILQPKRKKADCDDCLNYRTLKCPCGIFDRNEPRIRYALEMSSGCCDYVPDMQLKFELYE